MLPKIKQFIINNKITVGIVVVILILIYGGFTAFNSFQAKQQALIPVEEVDLAFDAEGPYALLFPRRDGNAVVLKLNRTSSYDGITYELAYVSNPDDTGIETAKPASGDGDGEGAPVTGVDRGVMGTINTEDKKGEYEQEILFGTCSKNVCKYDKGVENGTLTLHIRKGANAYRMSTQWHFQRPDTALGLLTSGDNHFSYKVDGTREELALIGYSVVNDLTGAPKLPDGKNVFGKAYGLNVPLAKSLPKGMVTFEVAENPADGAKIARFDEAKNEWIEYETKSSGGKLTAEADGSGIFAILVPKN